MDYSKVEKIIQIILTTIDKVMTLVFLYTVIKMKRRSAMTEINSDRVNKVQENFTFTFKRFVEYYNQQIIDQLVKNRRENSLDAVVCNIPTPLKLDELETAWSFYEDNFEWLEETIYNQVAMNYIQAHDKGGK